MTTQSIVFAKDGQGRWCEPERARDIMGKNFLGTEVIRHFGINLLAPQRVKGLSLLNPRAFANFFHGGSFFLDYSINL